MSPPSDSRSAATHQVLNRARIGVIIAVAALIATISPLAYAEHDQTLHATARLVTGGDVIPGPTRAFSVELRNDAAVDGDRAIDLVRVTFPVVAAGITHDHVALTSPSGWSATREGGRSQNQRILFTTPGPGLAPGESLEFRFTAAVARPASTDRSGEFGVEVDSSAPDTKKSLAVPASPGALVTTVRILELVAGPDPIAPTGVMDGSATGGQEIRYGFTVENHAQNAVTVTSALTSDNATDTIAAPPPSSIGGNDGRHAFEFAVTLGRGSDSDRTSRFTATVTAPGAAALRRIDDLAVQMPTAFRSLALSPDRIRSGSDYSFVARVARIGTPIAEITDGDLSFGGVTIPLATPASLPGGTTEQTFEFASRLVELVSGAYPAEVTLRGADANDAPIDESTLSTIVVDNQAPLLTVEATIPADQDAVKNGDRIEVDGTIDAGADDDVAPGSVDVALQPDLGSAIPVAITLARTAEGRYSFTGSLTADFDPTATNFVPMVTAADLAGNVGDATGDPRIVDNTAPSLVDPGLVESTTEIRISFTDTRVTHLTGGCDPAAYDVGGYAVSYVRLPGSPESCRSGLRDQSSGVRVLVLSEPIGSGDEPAVSYDAGNDDPLVDGAGNAAASQTIQTINAVPPPTPEIVRASRNAGVETAYFDPEEQRYYTRFAGSDFEITFTGAREGDRAQIVNGEGDVLAISDPLSNPDPNAPEGAAFEARIRVPLGSSDSHYLRGLRLVGANGVVGAATPFEVVLDTLAPTVASTVVVSPKDIDVSFSERVIAGSNFAGDWFAFENTPGGSQYYEAEAVAIVTETVRRITFDFLNDGPFGGVAYVVSGAASERYRDRAGNFLVDHAQ